MKKTYTSSQRKHLENKLIDAFKDEMNTLSKELQQILAGDLITAFQNRITVFQRIQTKTRLLTSKS
ncbi:MAG: hypothetical protein OEW62_09295 [Candidatus Bathyarchaeota archaeon]|jgi:hypothetical protein|nr:hypothetical protein [Candidatus Bathyarchaeota archaeon]